MINTPAASDGRRQDKTKQTLTAYNLPDVGDIAKVRDQASYNVQ